MSSGKDQVEEAKEDIRPWVITAARIGYATKGIFYTILGALAMNTAFRQSSPSISIHTILIDVLTQPYGQVLLGLMIIGLIGYISWRLIQAFLDPERKGKDVSGLVTRAGAFFSGVGYTAIAYAGIKLLLGKNNQQATVGVQSVIDFVFKQPLGRWLVLIVGIVFAGVGFFQFYRTLTAKFREHFDQSDASAQTENLLIWMGRIGFAARAVLYVLISASMIYAVWIVNPNVAGGFGRAIQILDQWHQVSVVLGLVAVGLIIYGLYALILARYREIPFG